MASKDGLQLLREQSKRLTENGWTKEPFKLGGPYPMWIEPETCERMPLAQARINLEKKFGKGGPFFFY